MRIDLYSHQKGKMYRHEVMDMLTEWWRSFTMFMYTNTHCIL